jgi:hypothetical protein
MCANAVWFDRLLLFSTPHQRIEIARAKIAAFEARHPGVNAEIAMFH